MRFGSYGESCCRVNGTFIKKWGSKGTADTQFQMPYGIAADGAGNIYVADASSYCVKKFGSYLKLTLVFPSATNYINTKVVTSVSAPIAASLGRLINPSEDFEFSVTIKNLEPAKGGVPLKNIVWQVWVDNNTVAQLYVSQLNIVRSGLSQTSPTLTSGTLVKEFYVFPSETPPQTEPRNHLGAGDSSLIRIKGKAGTNARAIISKPFLYTLLAFCWCCNKKPER